MSHTKDVIPRNPVTGEVEEAEPDLFEALSNAIDAFDVGATIADDDVPLWNAVLQARNAINAAS